MKRAVHSTGTIFFLLIVNLTCSDGHSLDQENKEDGFHEQRRSMVELQIEGRGVRDRRVLEAMLAVPRHKFVKSVYHREAYSDHPLPIGEGQTISQPYIVAFMTELLRLKGDEKVLEIGTGCGYQTAVLSRTAGEIYSIEILEGLCALAHKNLGSPDYKNIHLRCGDGYRGWPEGAPFDRIIVTAAPDHIPDPLVEQLAIGGIMVIPIGSIFQELMVVEKTKKGLIKRRVIAVRFVPMTGEAEEKVR